MGIGKGLVSQGQGSGAVAMLTDDDVDDGGDDDDEEECVNSKSGDFVRACDDDDANILVKVRKGDICVRIAISRRKLSSKRIEQAPAGEECFDCACTFALRPGCRARNSAGFAIEELSDCACISLAARHPPAQHIK